MIERYVASASTYASSIDNLILLIGGVVGFWFLVAQGVFFWLIFRFRHKEGQKALYITGEEKHQKRWVTYPHLLVLVCDVVLIAGAISVWVEVKQNLPEPQQTVRIIGQQWSWSFIHPGPDGKLDTPDDIATSDELHVQVNTRYHFKLEAKDVVHSFSVPVFRLKQDAIPGRVITGWFEPTKTGTFDIQCAEMCGIGHGIMAGRIVIETPAQHAAWVQAQSNKAVALNEPAQSVEVN